MNGFWCGTNKIRISSKVCDFVYTFEFSYIELLKFRYDV